MDEVVDNDSIHNASSDDYHFGREEKSNIEAKLGEVTAD